MKAYRLLKTAGILLFLVAIITLLGTAGGVGSRAEAIVGLACFGSFVGLFLWWFGNSKVRAALPPIIACPACAREVSREASLCPGCGQPIARGFLGRSGTEKVLNIFALIVVILLIVGSCAVL